MVGGGERPKGSAHDLAGRWPPSSPSARPSSPALDGQHHCDSNLSAMTALTSATLPPLASNVQGDEPRAQGEPDIEGGDPEAPPPAEKLAPQVMLDELEDVNVLGEPNSYLLLGCSGQIAPAIPAGAVRQPV